MEAATAISTLTPHIAELGTTLLTIGGLAVGASVTIIALKKGFGMARSWVKG